MRNVCSLETNLLREGKSVLDLLLHHRDVGLFVPEGME